jgi:hypothetical protein
MLNERSRNERIVSRCRWSAESSTEGRLLETSAFERVDHGVEHQADPRQRLHRPVVEEERQPPPLLLLGGDQLVGEPRALRFAHLRLVEQARVFDGAAGEVGEQGRAGELLAVEWMRPHELQRADRLPADAQGKHDRLVHAALAGRENRRGGVEEAVRFAPRPVEHVVRVVGGGDAPHRLDQRLEEARLRRQLLLDDLVPAPLGDDQVQREARGADDRHAEADEREPARSHREPDEGHDRPGRHDGDQQRRSSSTAHLEGFRLVISDGRAGKARAS